MHWSRALVFAGVAAGVAIAGWRFRIYPSNTDGAARSRESASEAALKPAVPPVAAEPPASHPPLAASAAAQASTPAANALWALRSSKPDFRESATRDARAGDVVAWSSLAEGSSVTLPVSGGRALQGRVNFVSREPGGPVRLGGELLGTRGSFAFAGVDGVESGLVLLRDQRIAFEVATGQGGELAVQQKSLASVLCWPLPREPQQPVGAGPVTPLPAVPLLSSRPSATAVLYLDFDGETVIDPFWNNGQPIVAAPALLSDAQITEVWNRVKEDFLPFNVDVTTNVARYNAAPIGRRMRCIVTPTSAWFGPYGGVAYLDSFRRSGELFSATVPCWVFNGGVVGIAEAASHEFGHTLGLNHDGDSRSGLEYYSGHGSGAVSWGPIMGATYTREVVQWSRGEYTGANNFEDDFAIIAGFGNGFGYVADEAGNTRQAAAALAITSGAIDQTGVITNASDVDFFAFTVNLAGSIALTARPATISPNVDLSIELHDSVGNVLATSNPDLQLDATLTRTLAGGVYYVKVQGTGRGSVTGDGYSSYGSTGAYRLSGTIESATPPSIVRPPVAQTVNAGSTLSFGVVAGGTAPLTYQWRKDAAALTGATAAVLTLTNVTAAHAGNYTVVVSNLAGAATSEPAALTIVLAPEITTQPADRAVEFGQSTTFGVDPSGSAPFTYAWRKNGAAIAGATQPSYTIASVQTADVGTYSVVVLNPAGSATSREAALTLKAPTAAPVIVTQPAGQAVNAGTSATFTVAATGGPFTYQWRRNGTVIPGGTGASLQFSAARLEDAGSLDVLVTNVIGTTTSAVATFAVRQAPVIVQAPESRVLVLGGNSTLAVEARGTPQLVYQWAKNGAPIPGATQPAFAIANAKATDAAGYDVTVTNAYGTIRSSRAQVQVYPTLPHGVHAVANGGYRRGGTVTISSRLAYSDPASALAWQVLLPAGWTFVSATGDQGDIAPRVGTADLIEWAWTTPPATGHVDFTYTVAVPAAQTGTPTVVARAIVRRAAIASELLATPDPLPVPAASNHSADTDRDSRLSLLELTRVIELYNTRHSTVRTGAYAVDVTGEDGFGPDSSRNATATLALSAYHAADSDRNGMITLLELTRVIELYNYRQGTVRTGQYRVQAGTEDGFAAGP